MTRFQIKRLIIRKCGLSGKLEERVGAEEGGGACDGSTVEPWKKER